MNDPVGTVPRRNRKSGVTTATDNTDNTDI
jgi:hypothetical protein